MLERMIADKRKEVNKLVARKKEIGDRIAKVMEQKKIDTFQGVERDEVIAKERPKRMSKKQKEEYALTKLRQMGIPNPRAALVEMGF